MGFTIFGLIAWLVGGWMFLYGLPMVFASKWFYKELAATTKEKPGLAGLQLHSSIMVLFGLWVLSVEYRLAGSMGWAILIPIIGYLIVLKGALALWAPGWVEDIFRKFYKTESVMTLWGVVVLAVGVLFWWLAFAVL